MKSRRAPSEAKAMANKLQELQKIAGIAKLFKKRGGGGGGSIPLPPGLFPPILFHHQFASGLPTTTTCHPCRHPRNNWKVHLVQQYIIFGVCVVYTCLSSKCSVEKPNFNEGWGFVHSAVWQRLPPQSQNHKTCAII